MRDDRRGRDDAYSTQELTELLGYTPAEWSEKTLTHNANNAVTAGIWRIRAGSLSAKLKVISPPGGKPASEEWNSSEDPSHWNYWEREALAYEYGVTSAYSAAGISGPRLLSLNGRPNGGISLWLEDAQSEAGSVPGTRWSMEDYRRFAHSLGYAQGRIVATRMIGDHPWLTRTFLRDYVLSQRVDRMPKFGATQISAPMGFCSIRQGSSSAPRVGFVGLFINIVASRGRILAIYPLV